MTRVVFEVFTPAGETGLRRQIRWRMPVTGERGLLGIVWISTPGEAARRLVALRAAMIARGWEPETVAGRDDSSKAFVVNSSGSGNQVVAHAREIITTLT